jgi:transposase
MNEPSEFVRESQAETYELRRQINELLEDGMERKAIAVRLGISRQLVDYQLKFSRPKGASYLRKLEGELANSLTREKFLRHGLKISQQMYRQLWWETKGRLPAPMVKHLR